MVESGHVRPHEREIAARLAKMDRTAAVRLALQHLAPELDDPAQSYETLLRLLHQAIPQELDRQAGRPTPAPPAFVSPLPPEPPSVPPA